MGFLGRETVVESDLNSSCYPLSGHKYIYVSLHSVAKDCIVIIPVLTYGKKKKKKKKEKKKKFSS